MVRRNIFTDPNPRNMGNRTRQELEEEVYSTPPRFQPYPLSRNMVSSVSRTSRTSSRSSRSTRTSRRKHNLTTEDLQPHFGRCQKDAAKELKCSWSTLKRICSRLGIRWPFRSNRRQQQTYNEENVLESENVQNNVNFHDEGLSGRNYHSTTSDYSIERSDVSSDNATIGHNIAYTSSEYPNSNVLKSPISNNNLNSGNYPSNNNSSEQLRMFKNLPHMERHNH